jgi:ribosomal protein S8
MFWKYSLVSSARAVEYCLPVSHEQVRVYSELHTIPTSDGEIGGRVVVVGVEGIILVGS